MVNTRDLQCEKTSLGLYPPTKERTSDAFLKNSAKSKSRTYLSLNLKSGHSQEKSWQMVSLSHTGQSMLSTGVYPREECVSTLSQILMVNVPQKYYLSPKACLGILRRASVRGKKLPEVLELALKKQAQG